MHPIIVGFMEDLNVNLEAKLTISKEMSWSDKHMHYFVDGIINTCMYMVSFIDDG